MTNDRLAVFKFFWDCGRAGEVTGLFISRPSDVAAAIGKRVIFGEILGKHSDVHGTLDEGDVTLVSDDPTVVNLIADHVGTLGYNPLDYVVRSCCGEIAQCCRCEA